MSGYLVISLDFELFWGVRDHRSLKTYGKNILGVREALPRILGLFANYGIHATFATAGLLFFDDKSSLLDGCPQLRPSYTNTSLSPYGQTMDELGASELEDPYHFGASLIRKIQATPGQEIATHTFSHYYCLEGGQTLAQFAADLDQAILVAEQWGIPIRSIVFPRNQWREEHLTVCRSKGVLAFRGNESHWLYSPRKRIDDNYAYRGLRMLDTFFNLTGHHIYPPPEQSPDRMINLPASRFLRPWFPMPNWLDNLRLRRIQNAMTAAARSGQVFHLWWHPHNFGVNTERNIAFLESILTHYRFLEKEYQFRSVTMNDMATRKRSAE